MLVCIATVGLEDLYDGVDALEASGIGAFDIMAYPYVSLPYQLAKKYLFSVFIMRGECKN